MSLLALVLPTINLPWPITLHALLLLLSGTSMILAPSHVRPSPSAPLIPAPSQALLGVATLALGLAYFSTAYVEVEKNQFLHASVPVRMILGVVMVLKVTLGGRGLKREDKLKLLGLGVYDLLGGAAVGFWLGNFSGRIEL